MACRKAMLCPAPYPMLLLPMYEILSYIEQKSAMYFSLELSMIYIMETRGDFSEFRHLRSSSISVLNVTIDAVIIVA